jgi:hypothetical protein
MRTKNHHDQNFNTFTDENTFATLHIQQASSFKKVQYMQTEQCSACTKIKIKYYLEGALEL